MTGFLGGGGSVVTTVEDLMRWARVFEQDLLPSGRYVNEYTSQGTVLGNRFVLDVDGYMKQVNPHPDNPTSGTYRGLKRIQVTGGYWGFTCCMSHFPEPDVTIVCLSNSDSISAVGTARRIADLLLEGQLEPPVAVEAATDEFIELVDTDMSRFTGSFRQTGNKPIARISSTRDGLKINAGYHNSAILKPISATTFRAVGESPFYDSSRFVFEEDIDGVIIGFTIASFENGLHENVRHHRVKEAGPYDRPGLSEFAGTIVSDELEAIYRFRVADSRLQLRVGSRRWENLEPLEADEFSPVVDDPHNLRFIRFTRDKSRQVNGFSIGFWRIHGVRFDRVPEINGPRRAERAP